MRMSFRPSNCKRGNQAERCGCQVAIRFFDMFAGIGGFRAGLEAIGGFVCVGHCEIDKNAHQAYCAIYNPKPEEVYFEDATKINPNALPDIDLICGGFPCQSFSLAGKRGGFDDARGTLFFEVARIAAAKRPAYLLLENVPGLLSHNGGRTFNTILCVLSNLGYDVGWQVFNSADFGVPQSRKRVYIVGFLRNRCPGQVFSFTKTNGKNPVQLIPGHEGTRVYSTKGVGVTLTSNAGGFAGNTGLYLESSDRLMSLPIKVKTEQGYQLAFPGDSIDLAYSTLNSRRGRVGNKIAHTLTTSPSQGYFFIDFNAPPTLTETARCVTARYDGGVGARRAERSGVFVEDGARAVLAPDRETVRQQGRRVKEPNESMFTLTVCDRHGVIHHGRVRKLMPIECWRLQGFTDEQFYRVQATGLKDAPLYKMAGNAVTVNVVSAVGKLIQIVEERMNNDDPSNHQ